MYKRLYLMRHGETLFNTRGKLQGFADSPLTTKGKQQAQVAAKYFKEHHIVFDHAYCSTSERAEDTIQIILGSTLDYVRNKELA